MVTASYHLPCSFHGLSAWNHNHGRLQCCRNTDSIAFLFFSFKRSNPLDQLPSCLMQCFILKLQSGILLFIIIETLLKCRCLFSPVLFLLLMIYHLSSSLSAAFPMMSILVSCHFMETLWLHHTPYMVFFHANFLAYFDFYNQKKPHTEFLPHAAVYCTGQAGFVSYFSSVQNDLTLLRTGHLSVGI